MQRSRILSPIKTELHQEFETVVTLSELPQRLFVVLTFYRSAVRK